MNGPVLTLFVALVAALLVIGAVGLAWPRQTRPIVGLLAGMAGGLCAMLALIVLLLPGPSAGLVLPVGLPGAPFSLAIDPLSGGFLLLISIAGTAALVFAAEASPSDHPNPTPALAIAVAGLLLTVLAADGITLAFGLVLGGGVIWTTRDPAASLATPLALVLLAAAAVIVALGLLSPAGGGMLFPAVRDHPTGALRASFAVLAAIVGMGALLGVAPLLPAHHALPPPAAALLSGGLLPAALYILVRILLDLGRSAAPLTASLPLLLGGAVAVILGGYRACRSEELDTAAAYGSVRQSGMAAIGLGLVLLGRDADLPDLAGLALSAVLLLVAMQAICGTLVSLSAGAIRQQAGTRRLDRLGGLMHAMPTSSLGLLVGVGGLSGLPPAPGFAALFLLFQAALAAPHWYGLGASVLLVTLVLLLAIGSTLAGIALVRLVGMACLGRPRVPRAAAAEEILSPARPALLVPVGLTCLLGLLPGPAVRLLAGGAIGDLTGAALAQHVGWLTLAPGAIAPGYAPVPVGLLLGLGIGGAFWWRRGRTRIDGRTAPLWQDGFASAPPWLPFGDPVTQWNGTVCLPSWPAVSRPWSKAWLGRIHRRLTAPALALIAAGILLALLAWSARP